MVDPQIRLQNIALEHAELLHRRSMAWAESTNRATMLMTIVGAVVVALALVGQATQFQVEFLWFALLVLPVVLMISLFSLGRINELDSEDWVYVQGLNRLRHLRLEMDPEFEPYVTGSRYDDVAGILQAYAVNTSSSVFHSFYVLVTLIGMMVAITAALLAVVVSVVIGLGGLVSAIVGVGAFVVVQALLGYLGYRGFRRSVAGVRSAFPTPSADADVANAEVHPDT